MANVSRRDFFKIAGGVVAGAALSQVGGLVQRDRRRLACQGVFYEAYRRGSFDFFI